MTTISIREHLLSSGRRLLQIGRLAEAREQLRRLLKFESTPGVVGDAHKLLGELEFVAGNYRRARRHFAAVIALRPYDTETCLRYADAVDADPDADPRNGWLARRRACRIDSFDSRCWTALGVSAIRTHDRKAALKAFRRAARLRPERLETLTDLVIGFISLGRTGEAEAAINCARFRKPNDVGILSLWTRLRFERARIRQERRGTTGSIEPVLLPFAPRESSVPVAEPTPVIIRADRQSRPAPHLLRLLSKRSDPRQAN